MKNNSKTDKIASIIMWIGLTIFLSYDIVNYYAIFGSLNQANGVIVGKSLNGTSKNKHWTLKYEYSVNNEIYENTIIDVTPFSNTYKQDMDLFIYYSYDNPDNNIALTYALTPDFRPKLRHYLTLDRPAILYLKLVVIYFAIRLLPIVFILIYTIVLGSFLYVFNRGQYYDFIDKMRNKLLKKNHRRT